jgi:hypothetical protein
MSGYEAMIEEVRFAEDSPLEETGFEPSVPLHDRGRIVGLHPLFVGSPVLASRTARAARSLRYEV